MEPIPGLDGSRRQQTAADLWNAWQADGRVVAVLTGFSGLGKTERIVLPLVARARDQGRIVALIDVPQRPTSLDEELLARLVEDLRDNGNAGAADAIAAEPSFATALRSLLRAGALVVVDEFQRLLDPATAAPPEPIAGKFRQIAMREARGGCLWLVSNRMVDPEWTEPFHTCFLEAPSEIADLERIVLEAIGTHDAGGRFPAPRRAEVAGRLGQNPRALRLLGQLLQIYPLEELVGPPQAVPEGLANSELTIRMERSLLAKAREGLSNAASEFLRDLAVLREPARGELLEAMGHYLGDAADLSRQLRERFILEVRGSRYRLHPVACEVELPRLRGDVQAYRAAHLRAGNWFAAQLSSGPERLHDDAKLALDLSGTRYHLIEAQALNELRDAVHALRPYIERKFSWSAPVPSDASELDAQISLLELYLDEPGPVGVEFQLARRLKARGQPSDLKNALPHAQRATVNQDFNDPWTLWMQIVYEEEGAEAAVSAAQEAAKQVAATKNLVSVYQLLGAALNHLGRDQDSVDACLEGASRCGFKSNGHRLVEQALQIAAAMPTTDQLHRARAWAAEQGEFIPQIGLADVLLCERAGKWRAGAETAQIRRRQSSSYLHLSIQEALCWLGAGQPDAAQEALDSFPFRRRFAPRTASTWLAAVVALRTGELKSASDLAEIYVDGEAPGSLEGLEAMLLREWDHRVRTIGEPAPSFLFPVLPPSVTGLPGVAIRPQHGPPVLPQHRGAPSSTMIQGAPTPRILAVGTEWHSGHGGLSTFNRQLCCALADAGADVVCLTLEASAEDRSGAKARGVTLVKATRTPGLSDQTVLMRIPAELGGFVPDFIVGHGRVTGPAASVLAEDRFPESRRLHFVHMAPDEIEWYKLDRSDDAGLRAEERTQVELDLGRKAHRVIAVGPRLHDRYSRDLSAYDGVPPPVRFDPGFDLEGTGERHPPPGAPWKLLVLGRAEDHRLKGLDIAASALGRCASRRDVTLPGLEMFVRGAAPDTAGELHGMLRDWSGFPGLSVVVRPFTTASESIETDLRTSSLVLMPSRTEGFGLVGLEAITIGSPVLLSNASGIGQLLRQALTSEEAGRSVVRVTQDDKADSEAWSREIDGMLRDREAAFSRAWQLKISLGSKFTWKTSVNAMLKEICAQR